MARAIAEETGLTQNQAKEVVQMVFDGITETLVQEGRIELRNFGVFDVRKRKPRKARNPQAGRLSVEALLDLRETPQDQWGHTERRRPSLSRHLCQPEKDLPEVGRAFLGLPARSGSGAGPTAPSG